MEFVPFLVMVALLKKTIDWLRVMLPDDLEARFLIPVSWLLGIGFALLFSLSEVLGEAVTTFEGHTLADADIVLVIVYGWAVASTAGIVHDLAKPTTPPHDGT